MWQGARIHDRAADARLRGAFVWVHGPAVDHCGQRFATHVAVPEPDGERALLGVLTSAVSLLPTFREDVDVEDFDRWVAAQGDSDA